MARKNKYSTLENVLVSGYAAEGKSLARVEGKVIFISGAVPGDVVHLRLTKVKKDWAEARVLEVVESSVQRVDPFCQHFGVCGGCKWQMLPYEKQLEYKQQEAAQNLQRIGKIEAGEWLPICGSDQTRHYRNKLEFTFSNKRYLTEAEIATVEEIPQQNALGYHVPRIFDKVIDIESCWLMDDINNRIRNTLREYALQHALSFYDIKAHTGWLRNLIIRHCTTGETMVNVCVHHEDAALQPMLDHLLKQVPGITTLLYTINPKWNDTLYDLTPVVYFGKGYVTERLGDFQFIISPKSFFQTNTLQAEKLYSVARDFAGLTGNEIVYDLYCGTGSIGIFMSRLAKKIIGVEVVEEAVEDAKKNAALNQITHASFFAGDVIDVCTDAFFETHGWPDVVITDPPRAGMHEKLVRKLLEMEAPKVVYVSCNTATQARDLALLSEKYRVEKVRAVDMFPHTHHIEQVALLTLIC
ncbi:MAG TPA: 23S rRNA (uracil(1939)-C(5))-methyltransferase RlmD [Ferruginibacter sp.]|nr:23S rRNA (uracil(1939)-C(5))-methyltransferase RlmD [Ferruginibacter sp.]HRO17716.1 23S rRNA (uracil(1939)-C(5))-methyltransferase RlmD [Ferruginibacter sp.]HRQ20109.1 23S rRNA (uracil(1939)-C(5))-methyltransferase RlmD [Ferruginibacter sp.]